MLSSELEYCLNDAFQRAREERHEFITVEHLLLALLDTPTVIETLKACGTDLAALAPRAQGIHRGLHAAAARREMTKGTEVQPTLGFQRVLQRAVFHVQSSGRKEVTPINVLVAIFGEKQSQAVYLLGLQDVDAARRRQLRFARRAEGAGSAKADAEETSVADGERGRRGRIRSSASRPTSMRRPRRARSIR